MLGLLDIRPALLWTIPFGEKVLVFSPSLFRGQNRFATSVLMASIPGAGESIRSDRLALRTLRHGNGDGSGRDYLPVSVPRGRADSDNQGWRTAEKRRDPSFRTPSAAAGRSAPRPLGRLTLALHPRPSGSAAGRPCGVGACPPGQSSVRQTSPLETIAHQGVI